MIKFEKWFLKKKYSLNIPYLSQQILVGRPRGKRTLNWVSEKKYSFNLPYLYDYAKNYTKKSPKMQFLRLQSEGIFCDFYVKLSDNLVKAANLRRSCVDVK